MADNQKPTNQFQAEGSKADSTDRGLLIQTIRRLCTQFRAARHLLGEFDGFDKARLEILNTSGSAGFADDDDNRFRALLNSLESANPDDRWIRDLAAVLDSYLLNQFASQPKI